MYWGRGKECEFREGTMPDQWTHRRAAIRAERGGREGTDAGTRDRERKAQRYSWGGRRLLLSDTHIWHAWQWQ